MLGQIEALLSEAMKEHQWPITASIGAIAFLAAPATLELALHAADSLMYRVKQAGKGHALLETHGATDPAPAPLDPSP